MLGERIALLRKGMRWSQAALAQAMNISASAVGMYEQGRREPSLEGVIRMAEVFGVSVDYLLTGKTLTLEDEAAAERAMEVRLRSARGRRGGLSREELEILAAALLTEA